ncbi:MAG TPA: FAD-binding oxidoreductase [Hyphomicrobiaceae bacterium]|nr:FAD-binding oxidoreductase [Hyphomicrobiaceae bacterium]
MNDLDTLADVVGPAACLTESVDIAPYAVDWRGAYQGTPVAVVKPASTAEVSEVMRRAGAQDLAVVPAGGRTGLCGAAVAQANGPPSIVLSMERMNRIRSLDARDFSVIAEAGCVVQNVQQAAADAGRLFPIQWGAQGTAQIGGMLGTNAGGIRTLRWGNARELVLGLEVVLPDGRVLDDLRRVRKDNSGYALRHLFIGAEGTLGVITAAAMRLAPPLRRVETAFIAVPNPEAALSLYGRMMESGAELIAFELCGLYTMEVAARFGTGLRMPLPLDSPWYVMAEIAAAHPSVPLRDMMEDTLGEAMEAGEVTNASLAESEAQRLGIWKIREDYPECHRLAGPSVATDTSVPVSAVPEFIDRAVSETARRWPEGRISAIGHAGDGNIHFGLQAPADWTAGRPAWVERADGFEPLVNEIAVSLGGSFSAEHGIGQSKRHAMLAHKDPIAIDIMRDIKATLDPDGRMNPGKVFP